MKIYEIVQRLIGEIEPRGESYTDEERYKNLQEAIELAESLITDIQYVARNKECPEYSKQKAGKLADKFLRQTGITNGVNIS